MQEANFAEWITAAVAGGALLLAWVQLSSQAALTREAAAYVVWQEYLKLCFENPTYSSSDLAKAEVGSLRGLWDKGTPESEKYLWFLSLMLNACERIMLHMPRSSDWKDTLADQVKYHHEAVRQIWDKWRGHYADEMNAIVQEGLRRADANS